MPVSVKTYSVGNSFINVVLADAITDYNAYSAAQSADPAHDWQTKIVTTFFDGTNYCLISESVYTDVTGV